MDARAYYAKVSMGYVLTVTISLNCINRNGGVNMYGPGHSGRSEYGTAVGEWICTTITRIGKAVWPYLWRVVLNAIGWVLIGILLRIGFVLFDYVSLWWVLR